MLKQLSCLNESFTSQNRCLSQANPQYEVKRDGFVIDPGKPTQNEGSSQVYANSC